MHETAPLEISASTKKISLRSYVNLLKVIGVEGIKDIDRLDKETKKMVRALVSEGLVTEPYVKTMDGRMTFKETALITPSGVSALVQWDDYLKEQTLLHKFGSSLLQLAWALAGALCAVMADMVN